MSSDPLDDDNWGYIASPMTVQLKAVLRQYPNNGQILKELVQNAEDAEATEAKFLLDKYEFGHSTLINEDLSEFQGPALYAYNNAKFEDQDWVGIRKLGESVKKETSLKIGKFGLGFKSVYHMTDAPSLMSGPRIVFFDPHQQFFPDKRALYPWNFQKQHQAVNQAVEYADQLAPFQFEIFNSLNILNRNYYDHTLFRFPLRKGNPDAMDYSNPHGSENADIANSSNPRQKGFSDITGSSNPYDIDKAFELLKSCQADKHMNLLFMKHLEKIQLFVRENKKEAKPVEHFRVQIADSCIEQVREERKKLFKSIDPNNIKHPPKHAVFPVDIEAITFYTDGREPEKERTTWLITQYIEGYGEIAQRAQELKLVPWVEIAAPCINRNKLDDILRAGHMFCFLPLPLPGDRQSMTGLPVHINAYFSLDSNRQHLKCPTGNNIEDENDEAISRNVVLLKHIFPKAFCLMIDFIISQISKHPNNTSWGSPSLQMLYNTIPDWEKIKFPCNYLAEQMFPNLLQKPIFFTPSTNSMQTYHNVVVDTLAQEKMAIYQNDCLVQVLLKAEKPVTRVPHHVIRILDIQEIPFTKLSADLVARSLQEIQNNSPLNVAEAIEILCYLVLKGCDLQGLKLLPLSDGTMTSFRPSQEKAVYIYTGNESDIILQPFKEGRFVNTHLSSDAQKLFQCIKEGGKTQLKYLTPKDAVCLLKEILPQDSGHQPLKWKPDEHPTKEWLQQVWNFLNEHFQTAQYCEFLDKQCLHILPWETKSGQMFLVPLTKTLPMARSEKKNCPIAEVVSNLQGIVFHDTAYIQDNITALDYWLPKLDAKRLLEILYKLHLKESSTFFERFINLSSKINNIKDFLAKGIAGNIESDSPELFSFMKKLPIFKVTEVYGQNTHSKFVPLNELSEAIPDGDILPTAFLLPKEFLDLSEVNDRKLAALHGVEPMKPSVFYLRHILPALTQDPEYHDNIQETMIHILKHQNDKHLYDQIKKIKFLPNKERLCTPSELFDPCDELLKAIFQGEDVFPKLSPEGNGTEYVSYLKEVGLKTSKDVTVNDLLKAAGNLKFDKEGQARSKAMLQFVEQNMAVLKGHSNFHCLKSTAWVLGDQAKPRKDYPSKLNWHGKTDHFCCPTDLGSIENLDLVGSTNSLIDTKEFVKCDIEFGWSASPRLQHVVEHLKNLVESYCPRGREDHIYSHLSREIYQYLNEHDSLDVKKALNTSKLNQWIWHGSGFVDVQHIIPEPFTFPLNPYCFSLPHDLSIFGEFFENLDIEGVNTQRMIDILKDISKSWEIAKKKSRNQIDQDLQICVGILQELTLDTHTFYRDEVYVPVYEGNNQDNIRWVPLPDSTYCGKDDPADFDDCEEPLHILHSRVPTDVREKLKVPSLISRFFDGEEGIEDSGQSQSLTDKIHDLISRDYTDGFSIIKELLQNADDAGATEMKILYDERMNKNAMKGLFDPGMQKCQGPAVWAYNNAKFTPKDFEHILDLGGATKEKEPTKIGRFGYGFNAVYNLTDVPTIVSDDTVLILDPDTSHLGRIIRNKAKPGKKLNVKQHRKFVNRFKNQFIPFTGIFGCDVLQNDVYDATLIRLPLRISKSDLSDEVYTEARVKKLLDTIEERCNTLLLFTQNVEKISVYQLNKDATDPTEEMTERFTLERVSVRELPSQTRNFPFQQKSFLKAAKEQKEEGQFQQITSSMVVRIQQSPGKLQDWLICSSIGSGDAYELSRTDDTLLPVGGVAIPLTKKNEHYLPFLNCNLDPEIFCFLPLNLTSQTGFPVHINGYFALESNRRNLCEKKMGEANDTKGEWNEILFRDIICHAFFMLLVSLTEICHPQKYNQYCLWPSFQRVDGTFMKILTRSFYQKLSEHEEFKIFSNGSRWMSMSDVVLLSESLQNSQSVCNIVQQMYEEYRRQSVEKKSMVLMPTTIRENFKDCESLQVIEERIQPNGKLFSQIILPGIRNWGLEDCNTVVKWALSNDHSLDTHLKNTECIPVAPDGNVLLLPNQLLDPEGRAASLYIEGDQRFPHNSFIHLREALLRVGMVRNNLGWADITERASTINNQEQAKKILRYLKWKLDDSDRYTNEGEGFQNIPFLCAISRQAANGLPWFEGRELVTPKEAYLKSELSIHLISSVCPLVEMDSNLARFLGLQDKTISKQHIIEHLCRLADMDRDVMTNCTDLLSETCLKIYQNLNRDIQSADFLKVSMKAIVLLPEIHTFVKPEMCAIECLLNDMGEYLFKLPKIYHTSKRFFKAIGVKHRFDKQDYLDVLQQIHTSHDGRRLNGGHADLVVNLLVKMTDTFCDLGVTFAPDEKMIMRETSALYYKDYDGLQLGLNNHYSHARISRDLASKLGIRSIREKVIGQHKMSSLMSFGQKEELTTRIKGILENCLIKDVLKELLQNADDAGASEIHFILDKRQHSKEKVFGDNWKDLQGPALLVYNDKPFSKEDFAGIQRLGIGSKRDDPTRTGQYGVGFNCVYHLTDAPSLVTTVEGRGEVLCIFDPHCMYAPDANSESPGACFKTKELEKDFADAFKPYLGDKKLDYKGGALFRFPLRTRTMARYSSFSKEELTLKTVDSLLNALKEEMSKSLLFLNNVKTIKMWDIEAESRQKTLVASVQGTLSEEDNVQFTDFKQSFKQNSQEMKNNVVDLQTLPHRSITYEMRIQSDNFLAKSTERWLISQSIGFDTLHMDVNLVGSVAAAKKRGELGQFPRGGVARLITVPPSDKQFAVFCFLPLPIPTKFPVHVNGHFVLDGPNRRGLWRDEFAPTLRTHWNTLIFRHVIVPAYVSLLLHMKEKIGTGEVSLEEYYKTFPTKSEEGYMEDCMKALYFYIYETQTQLLPVVRTDGVIEWYAPCSQDGHINTVYFNDLDPRSPLTNILLNLGFNLLDMPMEIHSSFEEAGVPLPTVNCADVLHYMKTDKCKEYLPLPSLISNTCLKNVQNLRILLRWCQALLVDEKLSLVEDLPIIATEDGNLQVFSTENNFFYSSFFNLVPESKAKFLHRDLLSVFKGLGGCFKYFDVESFAQLLTYEDNRKDLKYNGEVYKPWQPSKENELLNWLREVWRFIESNVKRERRYRHLNIHDFLQPLKEWHLLPVIISSENVDENSGTYLVPLKNATTVVHLTDTFTEVFKSFNFPKPYYKIIGNGTSSSFGSTISSYGSSNSRSSLGSSPFGTTPSGFGSPFRTPLSGLGSYIHPAIQTGLGGQVTSAPAPSLFSTSRVGRQVTTAPAPSLFSTSRVGGQVTTAPAPSLFSTSRVGGLLATASAPSLFSTSRVGGLLATASAPSLFSTSRVLVPQEDSDYASSIIKDLVATAENPGTMMDALDWAVEQNQLPESLDIREAQSLVNYFAEKLNVIKTRGHAGRHTLKSLPMFATYDGKITGLKDVAIHILPHDVPREGMDKWYRTDVFLKEPSQWNVKDLYTFLCLKEISIGDFYCDVVLKYYQDLSAEEWGSHLEYLRDKTENLLHEDERKILDKMTPLKFISHKDGEMFAVNAFFDQQVEVFRLMEREMLIQEKYQGVRWGKFFSKLGMKDSLTYEMFITYAKVIEEEGKTAADTAIQEVNKKSRSLQEYLRKLEQKCSLTLRWYEFLGKIKSIHFIVKMQIKDSLQRIAPQIVTDSTLTCYQGTAVGDVELVWTVAAVIDCCQRTRLSQNTLQQLGTRMEPQADLVIEHIKNVCHGIQQRSNVNSDEALDVLKHLYRYLLKQKPLLTVDLIDKLKDMPIVGIEHGGKLIVVKPKQVFLQREDDDGVLNPFVFQFPLKLGEFSDLFLCLGASEVISVHHYIFVLSALAKVTKGQVLDMVHVQNALKVITKLFKKLADDYQDHESGDVEKVYLLSEKKRLVSIDRLVYADKLSLAKRSELPEEFLFSPEETKLEASVYLKAIDRLTKWNSGKLKLLSSLLCEVLMPGCEVESYCACQGGRQLKRHLKSPAFLDGVIRIIHDNFTRKNCTPLEEDVTEMKTILLNLKVFSVHPLQTHLKRNGEVILNSETQRKVFAESAVQVGNFSSQPEVKIYIDKECLYSDVVDEIVSIVDKTAQRIFKDKCISEKYLMRILELEDPLAIKEYLDANNLIPYGMKNYTANMLPILGSLIPIADHHMLNPEFKDMEVGAFVAFETNVTFEEMDFENNDERTFQYAQILRKQGSEYQIDLGEDLGTKLVKHIFLFGFHDISYLLKGFSSRVPDYGTAKSMIDEHLYKAKSWTPIERLQVYKRLYLIWHPYEYLKKAILELEQKLRTSISSSSSGSSWYYPSSNWTRCFLQFEQIVTTNSTQWSAYVEGFSGLDMDEICSNMWLPPSLTTSNPQPRDAQRWLKQAEADYQAAPGDLGGKAYEWTCFKCHQAAEKALKSVRILDGSWPSDRRWTHRLRDIAASCGEELSSLAGELENVCEDSTKMRYPDRISPPKTPHDYYDFKKADKALKITEEILQKVKEHFEKKK